MDRCALGADYASRAGQAHRAPTRPEPEPLHAPLAPMHGLRIFLSSSFLQVMKAVSDTFNSRSPVRRAAWRARAARADSGRRVLCPRENSLGLPRHRAERKNTSGGER
jgi:hypothetical protein